MAVVQQEPLEVRGLESPQGSVCLKLYRVLRAALRDNEVRLRGEVRVFLAGESVDPLRLELIKIAVAKHKAKKAKEAVRVEFIKERVAAQKLLHLNFA